MKDPVRRRVASLVLMGILLVSAPATASAMHHIATGGARFSVILTPGALAILNEIRSAGHIGAALASVSWQTDACRMDGGSIASNPHQELCV